MPQFAIVDHLVLRPRLGASISNAVAHDLLGRHQGRSQTENYLALPELSRILLRNAGHCFYGQHEAPWLSFYDMLFQLGLWEAERLYGFMQVARSCGWWWPFGSSAVATERCSIIFRDPDGLSIWAWHGALVPERFVIHPETMTPDFILSQPRQGTLTVMIRRYGASQFLQECKGEILDEDQGRHGLRTLFRLHSPAGTSPPMAMIRLQCLAEEGTVEEYWLRVPSHAMSCREAVQVTLREEPRDCSRLLEM